MSARRQMSKREWLALANSCELQTIAPMDGQAGVWTGCIITCGPKFYAKRVMERTGKKHGARLTAIRQDEKIINPVTCEPNWVYVATFERLNA